MFEYFPQNYTWSLAVMSAINRGGQISEIDDACRPLHDYAARKNDATAQMAWFENWMKLAERVERLAQVDEQAGHRFSAGRKYLRAGLYFLIAERMPSHKDPRRKDAYKRGIALYRRGLELRGDAVEFVDVPYQGHMLPAYFVKAPGPGPKPCMVHFDGLDVMKELIYPSVADEFRRRGISLLIVDHPGVGAALRLLDLPSLPETEKPAGAAVDYLEARADVDKNRIGIMALSLGGYYAPRAASFEKRFKCCIAWGALYDYGAITADRIGGRGEPSVPGYAEHAQWVWGTKSVDETRELAKKVTLDHAIHNLTCPLLVVHGENDRQVPLWHAEMTVEKAVNCKDKELRVFTLAEGSAEHCGADNNSLTVDYMADWAAKRLGTAATGIGR